MSHNPNTVKSQDNLSTTNDGKRSSDVLLATIDELEKVKKENEVLSKENKVYQCLIDVYRKKEENYEEIIKAQDELLKIDKYFLIFIFVVAFVQLILELVK